MNIFLDVSSCFQTSRHSIFFLIRWHDRLWTEPAKDGVFMFQPSGRQNHLLQKWNPSNSRNWRILSELQKVKVGKNEKTLNFWLQCNIFKNFAFFPFRKKCCKLWIDQNQQTSLWKSWIGRCNFFNIVLTQFAVKFQKILFTFFWVHYFKGHRNRRTCQSCLFFQFEQQWYSCLKHWQWQIQTKE
jgi:hypothetical protein